MALSALVTWDFFEFGLSAIDFVMSLLELNRMSGPSDSTEGAIVGSNAEVVPTKMALGFNRLG